MVLSEPIHARAWSEVLAGVGFRFRPAEFREWIGIPDEEFAPYLVHEGRLAISPAELLAVKRARYRELLATHLEPDPEMGAALNRLRGRGLRLGLATSSSGPEARHTLKHAGALRFLDALVSASDVEHCKPHPEPYERAAAALDLEPEACAALEASPAGTASARAAGCLVLGVATTHSAADLPAAHRGFDSPLQALAWLEENLEPARDQQQHG